MKAWFMFDCHLFAEVPITTPWRMTLRAARLFRKDRCGSLFVRNRLDREVSQYSYQGHYDGVSREFKTPPVSGIHEWAKRVHAAAQRDKAPDGDEGAFEQWWLDESRPISFNAAREAFLAGMAAARRAEGNGSDT